MGNVSSVISVMRAAILGLGVLVTACAADDSTVDTGQNSCASRACTTAEDCAECSGGCNPVTEHCEGCNPDTGEGCDAGETCTQFGSCAPDGAVCLTDTKGNPTVDCQSDNDCAACDSQHRVCETSTSKCVACTTNKKSACTKSEACLENECVGKCPTKCTRDNDCAYCNIDPKGAKKGDRKACNRATGRCSECSPTRACELGQVCTPQGTCKTLCGLDSVGTCYAEEDCKGCREATQSSTEYSCDLPLNEGAGTCIPKANGCEDIGNGLVVLPDPYSKVTQACSNDDNCKDVDIDYNVGGLIRDLTGIDGTDESPLGKSYKINDANVSYGMGICADISIKVGDGEKSCGLCVPCKVDNDCQGIDVDKIATKAFGIGSVLTNFVFDQFWPEGEKHLIHMFCQTIAAGYGVCVPCPSLVQSCAVESTGTGECHDVCDQGDALTPDCGECAKDVCAVDSICCEVSWDEICVGEAKEICGASCE